MKRDARGARGEFALTDPSRDDLGRSSVGMSERIELSAGEPSTWSAGREGGEAGGENR